MSTSISEKYVDFRIGLSGISYLDSGDVDSRLPEKSTLPVVCEPICSHVDALWPQDKGRTFLEEVCSMPGHDMEELMEGDFYNIAADSLNWFQEIVEKNQIDSSIAHRAKMVLEELALLESEFQMNSKLLVRP